ncbi:unnamed protein product [Heligmosomoides polygyrus]|uniref:Transcription initiation factor TFIID subunit 1 n=1 Tax=Heligmosomoides polygyrus TaxID=6339 RepID=A0A183G7D4_HELPZ|nr:unnamed protein product [Heligmosomoides polygyrus]
MRYYYDRGTRQRQFQIDGDKAITVDDIKEGSDKVIDAESSSMLRDGEADDNDGDQDQAAGRTDYWIYDSSAPQVVAIPEIRSKRPPNNNSLNKMAEEQAQMARKLRGTRKLECEGEPRSQRAYGKSQTLMPFGRGVRQHFYRNPWVERSQFTDPGSLPLS